MQVIFCSKCGQARGRHQAYGYYCPDGNGFHPTQKFQLQVNRLCADKDTQKAWTKLGVANLEQEVARRVLKQVEGALSVFDLSSSSVGKRDLLDALEMIKRGYDL